MISGSLGFALLSLSLLSPKSLPFFRYAMGVDPTVCSEMSSEYALLCPIAEPWVYFLFPNGIIVIQLRISIAFYLIELPFLL